MAAKQMHQGWLQTREREENANRLNEVVILASAGKDDVATRQAPTPCIMGGGSEKTGRAPGGAWDLSTREGYMMSRIECDQLDCQKLTASSSAITTPSRAGEEWRESSVAKVAECGELLGLVLEAGKRTSRREVQASSLKSPLHGAWCRGALVGRNGWEPPEHFKTMLKGGLKEPPQYPVAGQPGSCPRCQSDRQFVTVHVLRGQLLSGSHKSGTYIDTCQTCGFQVVAPYSY